MARLATLKPLLPLIGGFLLLFFVAVSGFYFLQARINAASEVRHTLEVENRLLTVRDLLNEAETGQRGYLLTGDEGYLAGFTANQTRIPEEIAALRQQLSDNPRQLKDLADLETTIASRLQGLADMVDRRREGDMAGLMGIIRTSLSARSTEHIGDLVDQMRGEEARILKIRSDRAAASATWAQIVLGVAIALTIGFGAFSLTDARNRIIALRTANEELVREASERQSAEAQVRHLAKMEAVGQLTGGIAHDFNNMLAVITGAVSIAKRRLTGTEHPAIVQCLDAANDGARRAADLTSRLLTFSRRAPLSPQVLDVGRLVQNISELLRRTLGERYEIESVVSGGLWRICADAAQVESALVNLAVNARDAMSEGGKLTVEAANGELDELYARTHAEVVPGQYVVLSITDTGDGMTQDVLERAFEPFFTTKEVGKGTGLGLSQVFGFVKQSGGHVKIYSEVGRGTSVKVYLPRYTGADMPATEAAAVPAPRARDGETVLVVEDDVSVRAVSIGLLRELGYTVLEAASPEDALARLQSQPGIVLLFTDIVMPRMTGRQLADRALELRPDLRVLYTTGYTRNAVVHNGVLDPGVAFLPKPFTLEALAAKVRETLDR
jgi:signal transduction histidine kinase